MWKLPRAVGVLATNPGGAQGGFVMRGFSGDAINHLYNGINIGIQDLTGRTQDTFSYDRIEFLKGASAIESGVGSIGGSVNYVTKQPFSGPVQNETFISVDSFADRLRLGRFNPDRRTRLPRGRFLQQFRWLHR
jgi:iron complex outermembrane receptor protein